MAKGKAETKKKKETDDIEKFAVRLQNIAEQLRWDEREICEHTPEAQIVMHMIHLENRLETVAKNHDDLIDKLRIFEERRKMRKLKSTNCKELAEELNAIDQECVDHNYEDGFDPQYLYDATGLPTFGGETPENTEGIFSWDEKNLLVDGQTGWDIIPRRDYYGEV